MLMVKPYLVIITMRDGSQGKHRGEYPDGSAAVDLAMGAFPEAHRIAALELDADGEPRGSRRTVRAGLQPADVRRLLGEQQLMVDGSLHVQPERPPAYAPGVVRRFARSRRNRAWRTAATVAACWIVWTGYACMKGWL